MCSLFLPFKLFLTQWIIAYGYSHADWDGLQDHLRVLHGRIFLGSASAAASEFC